MKKLTAVQNKVAEALENGLDLRTFYSVRAILLSIGYSGHTNGRLTKEVKKLFDLCDIDYSHFTHNGMPPSVVTKGLCVVCNKEFISTKQQVTCSKSCSNTYFRSGTNHPNYKDASSTYRKKAIDYYGSKCAFCSESDVVEVHHIDENRENNSITNLIVLCPTHHTKVHRGLLKI